MNQTGPRDVDVAIVGAGISGLVAARRLHEAGVSSLAVLEAKDRVGGRTLNKKGDLGIEVEAGGQWIGPGQDRVIALAEELGVGTFRTYDSGRNVLVLGGRRYLHRAPFPLRTPLVAANLISVGMRLQLMAMRIDVRSPWGSPRARELDRITFASWLERRCRNESVRTIWEIASALALGGEPHELSLLGVLQHVRADGGLLRLLSVRGGAQESRFFGGSQALSLRLAAALGTRIRLSTPVDRVEWDGEGAIIHTSTTTICARRVVAALSPADRGRIRFEPELPTALDEASRQVRMATGLKVAAIYRRPFWREDRLSGQALSDAGPAPVTFDNSPPSGEVGVLTAFVAGEAGPSNASPTTRLLGDAAARRSAVLDSFQRYFGPRAGSPIDYVEQDWREEPFNEGCIPTIGCGYWTEIAPKLEERTGPLVWAGGEQSRIWNGYMDGAVRAGEHAAEILAAELSG